MMPVLDTTVLIASDRDPDQLRAFVAALLSEGEPLVVPVQAAIEYASGKADPAEAMRMLRTAFLVAPCGPAIALEAARLARSARALGRFPGWADLQIAATARHEGMDVVTRNAPNFEGLGVRTREHP
jgi:predicted nucleic acid-binding protein